MADIKIDIKRISRRQFRTFSAELKKLEGDGMAIDELTAGVVAKVVVSWPYDAPISVDGYLDLPLDASIEVDHALSEAFELVGKKK